MTRLRRCGHERLVLLPRATRDCAVDPLRLAARLTMQTFLPWPDFTASAACLDGRLLGKQVVEGYQIMKCLTGDGSSSWNSHPAVTAWRGSEIALMSYLDAVHAEWQRRHGNGTHHAAYVHCRELFESRWFANAEPPWWLGSPGFHVAHQLNLIRKDSAYRAVFPLPAPLNASCEPYLWPVSPGFFQVATRGNGASYASWYNSGQVTGKRLVISAAEADDRARLAFPETSARVEVFQKEAG